MNQNHPQNEIFAQYYRKYRTYYRTRINESKKQANTEYLTGHSNFSKGAWFNINGESVIIGSVYLPPNSGIDKYANHVATVTSLRTEYSNCKFVVIGDYNLPNIVWVSLDADTLLVPLGTMGIKEETICDGFVELNLIQHNDLKNKSGNVLDLCFSDINSVELISCKSIVPLDHIRPSFIVNYNIICSIANEFVQYYYDFAAASYIDMSVYLASFNWNTILDVDIAVDYFYYIIGTYCMPVVCSS